MEVSQQLAADAAQDETGQVNLILFQKGDGYDSSRLMLPTLHERLREHLGSPFLAAIPNRDILICIRHDSQILASVRSQVAQDFRTMPRQITERLFWSPPTASRRMLNRSATRTRRKTTTTTVSD